jgi:hypothetical protein
MGSVTARAISVGAEALTILLGRPIFSAAEVQPTAEAKLVSFCCAVSVRRRHTVWRRGELLVDVLRDSCRRFEMNPLLMVYFSVGASFAGVALLKLQARLERWAYQRHAED